MFDSKQTDIIRQVLLECDRFETLALVGNVPQEYQFTQEFEEKAEALKRRVTLKMKATLKRLLIAAVIVVLVLAATVAMVAGIDDSHIVLWGNAVQEYMQEKSEITDHEELSTEIFAQSRPAGDRKTLDIPALMIEYDLPIPEGYTVNAFNPGTNGYSIWYTKDHPEDESEDADYWHISMHINIYEIFENTNIRFTHYGEMNSMEFGDLVMYYYESSQTAEGSDFHSDSTHYMVKGDKYVAKISTSVHTQYTHDIGRKDMPTPEEIAKIFASIDEMLHAPMRPIEEIIAEPEPSENMMLSGTLGIEGKPETNVDFSSIKYRYLPVPEGYSLTNNNGGIIVKYQKHEKQVNGYGILATDLILEMVDLTVDPYIHTLYENCGDPVIVGDITLYNRPVTFIDYHVGVAQEYVYTSEKYAIVFTLQTSPQYGEEMLPTAEELAKIVEEINKTLGE